jgi:hypothetical protein
LRISSIIFSFVGFQSEGVDKEDGKLSVREMQQLTKFGALELERTWQHLGPTPSNLVPLVLWKLLPSVMTLGHALSAAAALW